MEALALLQQRSAVQFATWIAYLYDGRYDPLAFAALDRDAWSFLSRRARRWAPAT